VSTKREDAPVNGWKPGRTVEARVIFVTTDVVDPTEISTWAVHASAWEAVTMNISPTLSAYKPYKYISVDLRLTPPWEIAKTWTDLAVGASKWYSDLLAAAVGAWPNLVFDQAELEIR
jgi:hypothetical protein